MPYKLNEARQLCSRFKSLIGTAIDQNAVVENVAVAPVDFVARQRFLMFYLLFDNDAEAALAQDNHGTLFDVLLIARNEDGELVSKYLD